MRLLKSLKTFGHAPLSSFDFLVSDFSSYFRAFAQTEDLIELKFDL